MDPLSISAACVGVLSSVADLSIRIGKFIIDVRDARRDMDAVQRELSSLKLCVENLQSDVMHPSIEYPPSLRHSLADVLHNCTGVTVEMKALLVKVSSNSLGKRIQWATTGKGEMNSLRSCLQAHKATIEIALDMVTIFLISNIKQDTSAIKDDIEAIKQDASHIPQINDDMTQLLHEISCLKIQLSESQQAIDPRAFVLQRFLDQSTQYADSVVDQDDWTATEPRESALITPLTIADGDREDLLPSEASLGRPTHPGSTFNIPPTVPLNDQAPKSKTSSNLVGASGAMAEKNAPDKRARVLLSNDEQKRLNKELIDLCRRSILPVYTAELEGLVSQGADVNIETGDGFPMYWAAYNGNIRTVEWLVGNGADVNMQGGYFGSALHAAIYDGRRDIVEFLLDKGANMTARGDSFDSALGVAACYGRMEIAQLLLERGADVNYRVNTRGNALGAAVYAGKKDIVQLLLDKGADMLVRRDGFAGALEVAVWYGHIEIAQFLLEKGADVNFQGGDYGTALRIAAFYGTNEMVQLLLNAGAKVDIKGGRALSALEEAKLRKEDSEREAIVALLENV